jgi:DNA polymerase-3 subunit gamma/tau
LDAAGVRSVWSEVLAAVRGSSRSVEVMLSEATVRSVEGQVITLTHHSAPLVRRLSEQTNTELLTAALRATLGGEWQPRWEQDGAEQAPAEPPSPPPKSEPSPAVPEVGAGGAPEPEPAGGGEPEAGSSDQGTEDAAINLLAQQLGASKIDG